MIKRILLAFALLFTAAAPAAAQFADQATYAGTGAGAANAQTVTLANASSYADLVGVALKYTPGATNTGAATLNVNGFGSSPSFRKSSGTALVALTGGEVQSGVPIMVMYDGTSFDIIGPVALPVGAALLQNSALGMGFATNLQLNATVATNALTIAVKGVDGNDPSAANPVLIPFRDSTIANGTLKVVSLQAALSFTINSGSTMGCVSGQMCRLWIAPICSTGLECTNSAGSDVVGLCAFNARSGTTVAAVNEGLLQTSQSGTGGGNSAQAYYCNISAVTARAIRIIGFIEIQEVTAGTWATGPTLVQLFGPGIKRPGDVAQGPLAFTTSTPTTSSGATPTQTNLFQAITPTSAANLVRITSTGTVGYSGGGAYPVTQISRGASPTLIGNISGFALNTASTNPTFSVNNYALDFPNTTSSVTYFLYTWGVAAGGNNSIFLYATDLGATPAFIEVQEIMSALEPANDNLLRPLEMVG